MNKFIKYIFASILLVISEGLCSQNNVSLSFQSVHQIDSIKVRNKSNFTQKVFYTNDITLQLSWASALTNANNNSKLSIYPNPCVNSSILNFTVLTPSKYRITISDLTGKTLSSMDQFLVMGLHSMQIQVGIAGVYIVRIVGSGANASTKLICKGSSNQQPSINYLKTNQQTDNNPRFKANIFGADYKALKVSLGDKMEYVAYSGNRSKTHTDFLTADKTYTFDFSKNIWETLASEPNLDSLGNFLYSFDRDVFDPNMSTPVDVNELGQIIYSDSVLYNMNPFFKKLGALDNEDSSYVAILPTNAAWNKSYSNISGYFNYYFDPAKPETKITADTLQRKYTTLSIVKDLVFSKTMQQPLNWPIPFGDQPFDSLRSTSLCVFKQPAYLVDGLERRAASNGYLYTTNDLKYNHYESWNKENVVESERSTGRFTFYANFSEEGYAGSKYKVSGNRFFILTPMTTSIQPTVEFEIPNTLSGKLNADKTIEYGTAYNIYAVFLSPAIVNKQPKPAKVKFDLKYKDALYKDIVVPYTVDANNKIFETQAEGVTKMLVASNVVFPYCAFGLDLPTVRFKVYSIAKSTESVTYTRELFIDCIIFEPVK